MNLIEYQLKLWQVRSELASKGVHKPINEMLKTGKIKDSYQNHNLIAGRIKDVKFLETLIKFNNSIE